MQGFGACAAPPRLFTHRCRGRLGNRSIFEFDSGRETEEVIQTLKGGKWWARRAKKKTQNNLERREYTAHNFRQKKKKKQLAQKQSGKSWTHPRMTSPIRYAVCDTKA